MEFLEAVKAGKIDVVKNLIENGADIEADDNRALKCASDHGHTEIVKLLIDKGADVQADDNYALRWASNDGYTEIVKLLIEEGADVQSGDNVALRCASGKGYRAIVKLLLDNDANIPEHVSESGLKIIRQVQLEKKFEKEMSLTIQGITKIKRCLSGRKKLVGLKI